MSPSSQSNDEPNEQPTRNKKRRIQGACDACKRKKIRCDSAKMPGNQCTNCILAEVECTHIQVTKNLGPAKGYIENMEQRLRKMEALLRKLSPDIDLSKELDTPLESEGPTASGSSPSQAASLFESSFPSTATSSSFTLTHPKQPEHAPVPKDDLVDCALPRNDDDAINTVLSEGMSKMSLFRARFLGKSSGAMLIQTALDLKEEFVGVREDPRVSGVGLRRHEFWEPHPWEYPEPPTADMPQTFPDDTLMMTLIDYYFNETNLYIPLLHRPTFERSIRDGLHLTDKMFGVTVLSVCAIGSLFSDDPRVLLDGIDTRRSAGWKWFKQVRVFQKALYRRPCIYELQNYALSVIFLLSSSAPQGSWTIVGIAIRRSQEVGAHRKKVSATVENELWKRAFWVLVTLDRMISSFLGRPCAIRDDDFDLDYPTECDDEYWENPDPEKAFKQPPGVPSKIAYFNSLLKLQEIMGYALTTIYAVKRPTKYSGHPGKYSDQIVIAELDSAMNTWIDSIPEHLRRDPHQENMEFFNQSSSLHAMYYHLQILIHRPFIPSPRNPSQRSFPSLAICTNAARSCCHIIDMHSRRTESALPNIQIAAFSAGIVLLLNVWSGKRSGIYIDPTREIERVQICMDFLRKSEARWSSAGRFWDLLAGLATAGDMPFPMKPPTRNKRQRDDDGANQTHSSTTETETSTLNLLKGNIMDLNQLQSDQILPSTNYDQFFTLPMYGTELGRLPVYGSSDSNPSSSTSNKQWYPDLSAQTMSSSLSHASGYLASRNEHHPDAAIHPSDDFINQWNQLSGSLSTETRNYQTGDPQALYPPHNPISFDSNGPIDPSIWANVPSGLEFQDWGAYIANISGRRHDPIPGTFPDSGY